LELGGGEIERLREIEMFLGEKKKPPSAYA